MKGKKWKKKPPCQRFDDFPLVPPPPILPLLPLGTGFLVLGYTTGLLPLPLPPLWWWCLPVFGHGGHINLGEWHAWRLSERDYRLLSPIPWPNPIPILSSQSPTHTLTTSFMLLLFGWPGQRRRLPLLSAPRCNWAFPNSNRSRSRRRSRSWGHHSASPSSPASKTPTAEQESLVVRLAAFGYLMKTTI